MFVVVYLGVGIAYIVATPILEKSDEHGHYGYVLYLKQHQALPPLHEVEGLSFEFKQPPLYYGLVWLFSGASLVPPAPFELPALNPYIDFASPYKRNDNRNVYLHPPDHTPLGIIGRFTSLLFGLGTTLITYKLALEVFERRKPIAMVSALLIGFQPRFLYMASAVNNDAAAAFWGATMSWLLILRYKRPKFNYFPFLMGVILGLAILTKTSLLLFAPLIALALLICPRQSLKNLFREGLIILCVTVLVGGWWYIRNAIYYADPLTLQTHLGEGVTDLLRPEKLGHTLRGIEYTFWGNLARPTLMPLPMDHYLIWWGRLSSIILVVSVVHALLRAKLERIILILLSMPVAYLVVLVGYWNASQSFTFGRLLFPALCPLILVWVWGWLQCTQDLWRKFALNLSGGMMMCIGVMTPFVSIYPLYHPYRAFNAVAVQDTPHYMYVDEHNHPIAELIGYTIPEAYTAPGDFTTVELCWRVLGRTPEPFAIFLHILDISELTKPGGPTILGARRTYPGLGNLPTDRWPLQKTFCDSIMIPLRHDVPIPTQTLLEIGFINAEHNTRLAVTDVHGNPIFPTVAGPKIFADDLIAQTVIPPLYMLDQAIALTDIETQIQDSTFSITLVWQSHQSVSYDAVIFVHLYDAAGHMLSQIDTLPLAGRFSTSTWIPGQVLTDTFHLSLPTLYAAPLSIHFGMYEPHSFARLPVTDRADMVQPDNLIVISLEK